MRVGILGGSFNPPHTGHLILAESIREKLKLDKVIFVPANIPPLKGKRQLLCAEDRWRMVNLAIYGNPYLDSSKVEIEREGVSYTFETLKYFKELFGRKCRLFFIAGADVLKSLRLWKKKKEIFRLSTFVIVTRKGFKIPSSLPKEIKILKMDAIEISSSQIRRKIEDDKSIRYLVPDAVRKFIIKKKLYK